MSRFLETTLDGLVGFGRIVASSLSARVKNTLVTILSDRDGDGVDARNTDQTMWIASPLQYRPGAPQGTTSEECVYIQRGDQLIVIGTRDVRWQVEIVDGEVVLRALAQNGARVRLKPTGEVLIEGGDTSATLALTRDDYLQTELRKIQATLGTGSNGGGAVVFATPYLPGPTASSRAKVDR